MTPTITEPGEEEVIDATASAIGTFHWPCIACGSVIRSRLTPGGRPIFECTNRNCKRTYDVDLLLTARGPGRDGTRPVVRCRLGLVALSRRKIGGPFERSD